MSDGTDVFAKAFIFIGMGFLFFFILFGGLVAALIVSKSRKTRINFSAAQSLMQWADSQGLNYRMWGDKPLLRGGFLSQAMTTLDVPRSRDIMWGRRNGWVILSWAFEWSKPLDGVFLRYQWYRRTTYVTGVYVGSSLPDMGVSARASFSLGLNGSPTAGKSFSDLFQVESSNRAVTEMVLDDNLKSLMVTAAATRGVNTEWWFCDGWLFTARQNDGLTDVATRLRWQDQDLAFLTEVARAIPKSVVTDFGVTYGVGVDPDGVAEKVFPPS